MSRKLALIIGNSKYEDKSLAQLATPDVDVDALAEVLRDPEIGAFDEVVALVNQPATSIRRAVASFFAERGRDDLLLLYFSGHGIRDDRGQLFLAVKDTEHNLLRGTAIPAAYITDEMDNSRSRRQVLILDCCHSGAFARGMKGAPGASVGTATAFEGTGSGRVVLTATDSTQYAWEGDRVVGQAENSVFTHHLIQGLRTGAADTGADGLITLDELYDYVYDQVVHETPLQKPGKWSYGQQGEIVIARNPRPVVKAVELPSDLQQAMDDPRPWVREGAVRELDRLLRGSHPGLSLAAQEALKRMADDDSRRVASAAAECLALHTITEAQTGEAGAGRIEVEKPEVRQREVADKDHESGVQPFIENVHESTTPIAEGSIWKLILVIVAGWAASGLIGVTNIDQSVIWITAGSSIGLTLGLVLWRADLLPLWKPTLRVAAGWTVGALIGILLGVINTEASMGVSFWYAAMWAGSWIATGSIGGFTVALVLWRSKMGIRWIPILVIIVCGVAGALIGWIMGTALSNWAVYLWVISGAVGGLTIGLAIQRMGLSIHWKHILLITIGWVTAGLIGSAISSTAGLATAIAEAIVGGVGIPDAILGSGINGVISGSIIGAIGGLSTGLVLRQSEPAIHWKQIWMITLGWTIGWAIGLGIFKYIGLAGQFTSEWITLIGLLLSGFICGVIGGSMMSAQLGLVHHRE